MSSFNYYFVLFKIEADKNDKNETAVKTRPFRRSSRNVMSSIPEFKSVPILSILNQIIPKLLEKSSISIISIS